MTIMPQTLKFWPKWRNFAKSGHAGPTVQAHENAKLATG